MLRQQFTFKAVFFNLAMILPFLQSTGQDVRDHWVLGDSRHLLFTDTGLTFLDYVPFYSYDAASNISSHSGELLFSANMNSAYNKHFSVMFNGDSLFNGGVASGTWAQGVLIVPVPGDSSTTLYYLLYARQEGGTLSTLAYSLVDMSLDSGLGGIVAGVKNVPLYEIYFSEQLQAIRHGNGRDWWILGRGLLPTADAQAQDILVFLATSDTVTLESVFSGGTMSKNRGEMAASPRGDRFAVASISGVVELFDFDRCTGLVSNPRLLLTASGNYGASFSPSGDMLYVARASGARLVQVDLTDSDTVLVNVISGFMGPLNDIGHLELGPDGKIYVAQTSPGPGDTLRTMYLGVIHQPDLSGPLCQYDTFGVWLGGLRYEAYSLPNHANYTLGAWENSPCDTIGSQTSNNVEEIADGNLEIHPRLARSRILVNIPVALVGREVVLLDVAGSIVLRSVLEQPQNFIDVQHLAPGLFIAVAVTEDGITLTEKFVKL